MQQKQNRIMQKRDRKKYSNKYNERGRNMQKERKLNRNTTDTQNRDRFGGDRSGQKTRQLEIDRDNNRMRETY